MNKPKTITLPDLWTDSSDIYYRVNGPWTLIESPQFVDPISTDLLSSPSGILGRSSLHPTTGRVIIISTFFDKRYWAYIEEMKTVTQEQNIAESILGTKVWYGVTDICAMLSITPPKFHEWVGSNDPKVKFPQPDIFVVETPLWANDTIHEWLANNIRIVEPEITK